jgi:hypothetical protein
MSLWSSIIKKLAKFGYKIYKSKRIDASFHIVGYLLEPHIESGKFSFELEIWWWEMPKKTLIFHMF